MVNEKEKTIKTANNLSIDALYNAYFQEKLAKSTEDIKNGRVMSIEESIERMKQKYEGFNIS